MTFVIIILVATVALIPVTALIGEIVFRLRTDMKDREK